MTATTETLLHLPVQAPASPARPAAPPLVARLAEQFGATWLDETTLAAWAAEGGDRVVLLAGDPVQFPEGIDVAVVLPELQRALPGRFVVGIVPTAHEDAVARRHGVQRWPSLLFLRDGQYVTTIAGMHDWDDFVARVTEALAAPATRAPGVGIPVVAAGGPACH